MVNFFKSIKYNILGSAVLCILMGVLLVVYPGTSLTVVCRGVGVIILLTGAGFGVGYLAGRKGTFLAKLELTIGSILMIVGGFIALFPKMILSIVPLVFGILFFYHGIANVKQAWELKGYRDKNWWLPVMVALSTVIIGLVIVKNPFDTLELLMRVIGACLIFDGLSNTMLVGHFAKSIRNYQRLTAEEEEENQEHIEGEVQDVIEGEYKEVESEDNWE